MFLMTARDTDAYQWAFITGSEPEEPAGAGCSVMSAVNGVYEPETPQP